MDYSERHVYSFIDEKGPYFSRQFCKDINKEVSKYYSKLINSLQSDYELSEKNMKFYDSKLIELKKYLQESDYKEDFPINDDEKDVNEFLINYFGKLLISGATNVDYSIEIEKGKYEYDIFTRKLTLFPLCGFISPESYFDFARIDDFIPLIKYIASCKFYLMFKRVYDECHITHISYNKKKYCQFNPSLENESIEDLETENIRSIIRPSILNLFQRKKKQEQSKPNKAERNRKIMNQYKNDLTGDKRTNENITHPAKEELPVKKIKKTPLEELIDKKNNISSLSKSRILTRIKPLNLNIGQENFHEAPYGHITSGPNWDLINAGIEETHEANKKEQIEIHKIAYIEAFKELSANQKSELPIKNQEEISIESNPNQLNVNISEATPLLLSTVSESTSINNQMLVFKSTTPQILNKVHLREHKPFIHFLGGNESQKPNLLEYLRKTYAGEEKKTYAIMILALEERKLIAFTYNTELYTALRNEFGEIGSNSFLNRILATDMKKDNKLLQSVSQHAEKLRNLIDNLPKTVV